MIWMARILLLLSPRHRLQQTHRVLFLCLVLRKFTLALVFVLNLEVALDLMLVLKLEVLIVL